MKYLIPFLSIVLLMTSCRETNEVEEVPAVNEDQLEEVAYLSYGDDLTSMKQEATENLEAVFAQLQPADTVMVKVKTVINEVCAKKGCWVEVPVGQDQAARVTFKDYSFFLPRNSQGKEVILSGKAFKSVTSVEDAKHYAMDGGKSQEEIDAITEDQVTLSIIADGALVQSYENPDVYGQEDAIKSE